MVAAVPLEIQRPQVQGGFMARLLSAVGPAPVNAQALAETFLAHEDPRFLNGYRRRCQLPDAVAAADWRALKQFALMCKTHGGVFAPPVRVDRGLHRLLEDAKARKRFERALGGKILHSPEGLARAEHVERAERFSRQQFGRALDDTVWCDFRRDGCVVGVEFRVAV